MITTQCWKSRRALASLGAIGLAGLLLGQQSASTSSSARTQQEGGSAHTVAARTLLPLEDRQAQFVITEGERAGETVTLTVQPLQDQSTWSMRLGDVRETIVRERPSGEIVILAEVLYDKGYRIEYSPPVRLLPATIVPNTDSQQRSSATIYDLEDREVAARGAVTHRVEEAGRMSARTQAGTFEGHMIRLRQVIDSDFVNADIQIDAVYVPGFGRVYLRVLTETEKLGLFSDTSIQTLSLQERPDGN